MGMLYKECSNCGGVIGIFGHYVGWTKCETCNIYIEEHDEHYFQKHNVVCPKCNLKFSFESMGDNAEARCVKCDCRMNETLEQKQRTKRRKSQ